MVELKLFSGMTAKADQLTRPPRPLAELGEETMELCPVNLINVRMTQRFACDVSAMFLDGPSDTVCVYDDAQRTTDSVDSRIQCSFDRSFKRQNRSYGKLHSK
jgi:hypothetical protein